MNKIHNVIWSTAHNAWVVVAEGTKSSSKSGAKALRVVIALIMLSPAAAFSAELPQGGSITVGTGTIVSNGSNQLVIKQATDKLGINWQSFNVGADGHVIFDQPGIHSIAMNRVVGSDGSAILGKINANGQVFLINPNGVIFGKDAKVNVGGLVASTLNITDEDFKNGNFKFNADATSGEVINHGSLEAAEGGYVALLGKSVKNNGVIKAKLGTAALAAGSAVTLDFSGDGLIKVQVDQSAVQALVDNKGLIMADGGHVLMTARASNALLDTVVNNEGIIQAQTINNKSGRIFLDGGFDSGTVTVAGTLDASAPTTGDGGFVETSGANVQIGAVARVSTLSKAGKTGKWLVDPTDFTISNGTAPMTVSGIGNTTLESALALTNVELQTSASGSEAGDITVNGEVAWSADTTLTLTAHNDIIVKNDISVNGTNGGLVLNHGDTSTVTGFQIKDGAKVNLTGANSSLTENGKAYIVLRTVADLAKISDLTPTDYFALGADIDASATRGANGGNGHLTSDAIFAGVFDGLGHTIDSFFMSDIVVWHTALIRRTDGATIKNLSMTNAEVEGGDAAAILLGDVKNTILRNINISGKVSSLSSAGVVNSVYWGGLDADNVHADVELTGLSTAAGIAIDLTDSVIKNSSAHVVIRGEGMLAGIATQTRGVTLLENVSTSGVIYSGDIGSTSGVTYIGDVTNGGLVAKAEELHIKNSYSTIDIEGGTYNGGLLGVASDTTVENSYSTGNISAGKTGNESSGGIVGKDTLGIYTNVFATGNITGSNSGGLAGSIEKTKISNSYTTGEATGYNAGGLVGKAVDSHIEQSYSTGKVGSLPPPPPPPPSRPGLREAFTTEFLEGMPGGFTDETLELVLSMNPGGFPAGFLDAILQSLLSSYPNGLPPGFAGAPIGPDPDAKKGGLIGSGPGNIITESFWDIEKSDQLTSLGGVGKTTSEMHSAATFAGWSIGAQGGTGETWRLYDGFTGPLLRFAMTKATVDASDKDLTYSAKAVTVVDLNADSPYGYTTSIDRNPFWSNWGGASVADLDKNYILGGNTVDGGQAIRNAGTYTADAFYSTQFGYDIVQLDAKTITVDKAALAITGSSTATKVYDGILNADVSLGFTALGGDVVSATVDAHFADKNAGTGKNVVIKGITLNGAVAGNYYLSSTPVTTVGNIDKASLNVSAIGTDKIYDDSTEAVVALSDNRISGDVLVTRAGTSVFSDKNAGVDKTVNVSGIALSGVDADNYTFNTTAISKANITKANLVVKADNGTKVEGTKDGQLKWNLQSGSLFGSDIIQGNLGRNAGESAGLYDINQGDLSAGSNYALSVVPGKFEITKGLTPPVVIVPVIPPVILVPVIPPVITEPTISIIDVELAQARDIIAAISVATKGRDTSAKIVGAPKIEVSDVLGDYRLINQGIRLPDDGDLLDSTAF